MKKKNLALGALLVVLAAWALSPSTPTRANRTLAKAFPAGLLASPASCTTPEWPAEARRYEIDGITVLNFRIGEAGNIESPQVVRSSGWQLLDEAALRSLVKCTFKPGLDEQTRTATYPIQFVWTLTGPAAVRPALVEGSCAPSTTFMGFDGYNRKPSGPDGVLVRFLVDPAGTPFGIQTEGAQVTGAEAYIAGCKFATDPSIPGEHTDTLYGRVLVRSPAKTPAPA